VQLTPAQIADQYAWLYTDLPVPAGTWDHLITTDGCYVGIKKAYGIDYVMFRGSTTFLDWIEDFAHFALPYDDSMLGGVHPGFRLGVLSVEDQLNALVGPNVVCVGHSLGAGHALIYAGFRLAMGKSVDQLVLYGAPRAGGTKLNRLLDKPEITNYRNEDESGFDLVTKVPFSVPPMIVYYQPRVFTDVTAHPDPDDPWTVFKYHHFGLYCRALGADGPAAQSLNGYHAS
jgi:pimeloyl-ACP methyl ester carboxylesterase